MHGAKKKTYNIVWTVALDGNETANLVSSNKQPEHYKE